jgi:hypothetical protein
LNCITNCIFNWIGIGNGFELGYGFGWEMEWIGIGHITWIGNDWSLDLFHICLDIKMEWN